MIGRLVLVVTAFELALAAAAAGALGVLGAWSGWLDLLNHLAPAWLVLALAGAALGWAAGGEHRRLTLTVAGAGAALALAHMTPELLQAAAGGLSAKPAGPRLRVLTYNTWRDNYSPHYTAWRVIHADADVAALPEGAEALRSQWASVAAVYPYGVGCPSWVTRELLLVSKRPILASGCSVATIKPGLRVPLLWMRTTGPDGRPVTLATTHLQWPIPPGSQALQRAALPALVRRLDTRELILAGDFNLTPWSYALRRLDRGLAPLTRRTRALATFPDRFARVGFASPFPLLPIDHIYAGPAWRTAKVERLGPAGSDHYGVVAELGR
jgi:endonuclease/exonuclease/phosphatase (EEP) superfamily protein YafD